MNFLKWGCLSLVAICVLLIGGCVAYVIIAPEGGVRLGNNMEDYALKHLAKNNVLGQGENLLAYYDVTMRMDGSEAAILTDQRVVYFKGGRITAIPLADVTDVKHRQETLTGDVIEVYGTSGQAMVIEIAPLNDGETFWNQLVNITREKSPRLVQRSPR